MVFNLEARTLSVVVLLLGACGDDGAVETADTTTGDLTTSTGGVSSTSGAVPTSTDPTTTADDAAESTTSVPVDPCACADGDPVIHAGKLVVADLAAYEGACLTEVDGSLELADVSDPSQLTALTHLRRAGSVWIHDSPGLVDLAPLACLRDVDRLSLTDNPALVDIGALAGLERAPILSMQRTPIAALPTFTPAYQGFHTLFLEDLPAIRDLDPLAGSSGLFPAEPDYAVFDVAIHNLPALESIAGLAGPIAAAAALVTADSPEQPFAVELIDLPALQTLDGLEPIVAGDFRLRHLPGLTDLGPLGALERTGRFELAGLGALTSLAGLDSLTHASQMILGGCDDGDAMTALQTLAGADALAAVEFDLWIVDTPALTDLALPALTDVTSFSIVDAPSLSDAEVAAFTAQVDHDRACAGGILECSCIGQVPEPVKTGCPDAWSGGSAVVGVSEAGPFDGTTAFFAWVGHEELSTDLALVILDTAADIELAKAAGIDDTDNGLPKAIVRTNRGYPQWLGATSEHADLHAAPSAAGPIQLDIQGRLGNWTELDPADPPRLFGQITTSAPNPTLTLDGPFEAVFCEAFIRELSD